jgi:HSP20 family protein
MMTHARNPFGEMWGEMHRVQDELNRLFGRWPFRGNSGARTAAGLPAVNVWEDDQAVYAEADLPGLNLEKLEVFVTEGNQLTIQGERPATEMKNAVWHRQERPFGQFLRVVTLPALVDADKVEARYEQGVLRLTLPKSEAAKPRKIAVKAE